MTQSVPIATMGAAAAAKKILEENDEVANEDVEISRRMK